MRNNKSYNYTDEFSDIVHTARFINAAELSGLFFSYEAFWTKKRKRFIGFGAY